MTENLSPQQLLELKDKLFVIVENLGSRLSPNNDVDEPDCNILNSDHYSYNDETWEISASGIITHCNRIYDDWWVVVVYNQQLVFRASSYVVNPGVYTPGQWQNDLENLYRTALSK